MPGVPRETDACPILRPTKAQFEKPFLKFASDYFLKNPNVPIIKVIPPTGFKARSKAYDLDNLTIDTPIEQRVLMHDNRPGHYDCVLLAQPSLTVKRFSEIASERGGPKQGVAGDELHERAFWSSLTVKPPLYGADTPVSLFDEDVKFGWNLRKLGCLLSKYKVARVPGVTTPMTYFGMWKSFFSWHVEDADLLSINYLHFGASKVWYAVAPGKDRRRFEELAKGLFPKEAARCGAFLRHKSFLITPQLLKKHGIPYVKVKHNPGEFVILNAGAYHAGYNQGFNCAEAVNFATEGWIELGKQASPCKCSALGRDAVRLNMSVFPGCHSSTSSQSDSSGGSLMSDAESMQAPSTSHQRRQPAKAKATVTGNAQERAEEKAVKRGPGRPRKQPVAEDAHPPRGPGRPPKQPTAQEAKTSRGPGRPPKQPITEDAKPARGPGRPPKQSITDYAKPPQDPGRPVKQPIVEDAKPPRGPGRPRKQPNTEEGTIPRGPSRPSMLTLAPEVKEAAPVVKRGLGRPRKAVMEGRDPEEAPVAKRPPGRPRKAEAERSRPSSATLSGQRLSVQDPAADMDVDMVEEEGRGKKRRRADPAEELQHGVGPEAEPKEESPEKKRKRQPAGLEKKSKGRPAAAQGARQKVKRPLGRPKKHLAAPQQDAAASQAQAKAKASQEVRRESQQAMDVDVDEGTGVLPRPQSGRVAKPNSQGVTGVVGQPYVIVGQDDTTGNKFFYLVQKLAQPARRKGDVSVRWLVEGGDGLYYPHHKTWDEKKGSLIEVRTQACKSRQGEAAFKLLTMRSKIYDVELSD